MGVWVFAAPTSPGTTGSEGQLSVGSSWTSNNKLFSMNVAPSGAVLILIHAAGLFHLGI